MVDFTENFDKRKFWRYINQKMKRSVHHYHILSVIVILFEELVKDLIAGKEIKIINFGSLSLYKTNPRRYFNVTTQQMGQSKGRKLLKFEITKKLRRKLFNLLDVDKTLI